MSVEPLILVVDDEPDILSLHRMILEREGWRVAAASDGVEAIQKAGELLPDVIVLDVMMPRMNGYQVCRLLKNDPRTLGIPIVICSVRSLESEKLYGYTSGADHYLVKPFDPADLVALVRTGLAGRPPRPPAGEAPREAPHPTSTDTILSDVNRLLDRRLMELTILHHVTRAMSGTLHVDDVLGVVLQSIVSDLGYPGGMIFLVGAGGALEERLARAAPLVVDPAGHPLFDRVLREGVAVTVPTEELCGAAPPELCARLHGPAAILVPIRSRGNPVGMLVVESPAPAVERDQREFLQTLAGQSGLAIENANLYARTLQLSITDGLTGVFNHRHLCERLEMEVARSRRYQLPLGLLMIDIDHFKLFNDRYGHLVGDEVLKAVAHCIRASTRDVDVVARYGGEEFGVVLQESGAEEVAASAERVRAAVAAARVPGPDGTPLGVTVSVGAAAIPGGDVAARELVRRADEALYAAKERGRDRVEVWRPPPPPGAP